MKWSVFVILLYLFPLHSIMSEHAVVASKVREELIKRVERNYPLQCISTVGEMMGDVQLIGFDFERLGEATVPEVRQIMVEIMDMCIEFVNSRRSLRPYLRDYPVTAKNIEIGIFILKKNGASLNRGDFNLAISNNGHQSYLKDSTDGYRFVDFAPQETFIEAKKKVKLSKDRSFHRKVPPDK